jgi:hypothetical protein
MPSHPHHRRSLVIVAFVLMSGFLGPVVRAQQPATVQETIPSRWSLGARGGVSLDPKQVYFGVQVTSPGLARSGHLIFRPNFEVGVGEDTTLLTGNLDVLYWAQIPNQPWKLMFGASPRVVYEKQDAFPGCDPEIFDCSGSSTGGGLSMVVAMEHKSGFSIELRTGGGEGHELQFGVAYVFKK